VKVYLLPTPIGDNPDEFFSSVIRGHFKNLSVFVAENSKSLRSLLGTHFPERDQSTIAVYDQPAEDDPHGWQLLWEDLQGINACGLVSDAGNPCIADPGYHFVDQCIRRSHEIIPISGPSSILLALMASGMNGQDFRFHGYLPRDNNNLRGALRRMEQDVSRHGTTQIWIETPYRNEKMLKGACAALSGDMRLCVAAGLQTEQEHIRTLTIRSWKKIDEPGLHKIPAVYCLGR